MFHYLINRFSTESDIPLPCDSCSGLEHGFSTAHKLAVQYAPENLVEFPRFHLVAHQDAGRLRAYDVGVGSVVIVADRVTMFVGLRGDTIVLDYEACAFDDLVDLNQAVRNDFNVALASACVCNLGMSLCSVFRGDIPLHAAGVEVDGKLIGIMGPSGMGKTTMLWSLMDQGARFVCDDVLTVHLEGDTAVGTASGSLSAKLSLEALAGRNMDWREYREVLPGRGEFWVPIPPERRLHGIRQLAALFVLRPSSGPPSADAVTFRRIVGGLATSVLMEHTQGLWASYPLADAGRLFAQYVALLKTVPVFSIEYVRHLRLLPAVAGTITRFIAMQP